MSKKTITFRLANRDPNFLRDRLILDAAGVELQCRTTADVFGNYCDDWAEPTYFDLESNYKEFRRKPL